MSVLDRKLRRDLMHARGMLAAVIGIISVGIACFVSMASLYLNLEQARRSYYARNRMADFWVGVKKVPISELGRITSIPGVAEIRPRISFAAVVDLDGVEKPLSAQVLSLPDRPRPVINDIVIKSGGYFTGSRVEEVIINDAFARARRIRAGDKIHIILNNRRQELTVVGTAISSEFVYLLGPGGIVPDPLSFGVFYVPLTFAEDANNFEGAANEIVGRLKPRYQDRPDVVLQRIEDVLEPYGVGLPTPLSRQASHWFLSSEITGLKVQAVVLPGIFLAVAVLVLNVLMTRIAEQQRTIVGTLKALGYSNAALLIHFLKFGVVIGIVGGLLGAVIGYFLAGWITEMYKQFYEFPRLVNLAHPSIILTGMAISIGFSALGTLRGVKSVMQLEPAAAMRPKPPPNIRRLLIERWTLFWRQLGFRWHMVLRGIFRHRMRTAAGVVAAALGAALILVTFTMRDSMLHMLAFQFDKVLLSDFELSFEIERGYSAMLDVRAMPGVDSAEPVLHVPCTLSKGYREKEVSITGIREDASMTVPRAADGTPVPVPRSGLMISRKLATVLGVAPGEQIVLEPLRGRRDPRKVLVTRVMDSYLGLDAYANYSYLNELIDEQRAVSTLQLKTSRSPEVARQFYRELKQIPAIKSIQAVRDQKQHLMDTLVGQMLISVIITIVFAGLIFFGSILNASLISLSERRQEIATLRVLGYTEREVGSLFLRESVSLNLLGTLLGLPLGYALSRLLTGLYDTELFRLPFVASPSSYLITVLLGLAFTLLAHSFIQRNIRRMDWLDALNVKE